MLPKLIAVIALLAGAGAALLLSGAGDLALAPQPAAAQAVTDYDTNDNGLIEVGSLAQLNAIRWDLNGDGATDATSTAANYLLAFPNRDTATSTRMGCPAGNCAGYELTASLTFATSTSDDHTPWTPLGTNVAPFNATFDGAGYTLTGMSITAGPALSGLFGAVGGGGAGGRAAVWGL